LNHENGVNFSNETNSSLLGQFFTQTAWIEPTCTCVILIFVPIGVLVLCRGVIVASVDIGLLILHVSKIALVSSLVGLLIVVIVILVVVGSVIAWCNVVVIVVHFYRIFKYSEFRLN
jgi:hypothetical protein